MRFLSVCSGIEAASVAFHPLGWKALAFSEIEAFPRSVLAHHYPDVPLHGDFTVLKDEPWIVDADMLCGGTPCQAFSVAGNRQSLADDRGNLTLQFVLLANAIDAVRRAAGREPAWVLWENVPGVLSTNDNAFGAFLGGLVGRDSAIPEPEGGWTRAGVVDGPSRCAAWRVLDAQHFGLAQRRQRVFVLARGGAGRWAVADALLPIIESSAWHAAPIRGKGEGVAGTISARTLGGGGLGTDFECGGGLQVAGTIGAQLEKRSSSIDGNCAFIPVIMSHGQANAEIVSDGEPSLTCNHEAPILVRMREGKEGGGKGPLVSADQSLTLATANDQVLCQSLSLRTRDGVVNAELGEPGIANALRGSNGGRCGEGAGAVLNGMQVRRLTPIETSRLQGFPDTYCHIPTGKRRKIPADEAAYLQGHGLNCWQDGEQWFTDTAADGPIYKAHGNSWAVNCVRWIGEQIERVRKAETR